MIGKNTLMTLAVPKDYERKQCSIRSQILLEAAMLGQGDRIRNACKDDVDTEIRDPAGRTPLLKAAAFGRTDAVLALLEAHADIAARDERGFTALKLALGNGFSETARALREHGAVE